MRNVWPVKLPSHTGPIGLLVAGLSIAALLHGAVALPGWHQILFVLMAAFPLNLLRVMALQRRRDEFESRQWRRVLGEGATPLRGGRAYLTLSADQQELHCVLRNGRFARQSLQGLESLWIEAPTGRQRVWTLKCDRTVDEPLRIRFSHPRDAEGWFWRLLDLRPELGRDRERLRSVDVVGQAGVLTLDQQREWGLAREPRHEAWEQVWAAGVTPEYAQALVKDLAKRKLSARIQPTAPRSHGPLVRMEPTQVLSTPHSNQPEPPVVSVMSSTFAWGSCLMVLATAHLILDVNEVSNRITSLAMLMSCFSVILTSPIALAFRSKMFAEAGLSPGALLEENAAQDMKVNSLLLIPAQDETGFMSAGGSVRPFPISQVESITLAQNEVGLRLTVVIAGEVIKEEFGPTTGEARYCQWLAGLQANRYAPSLPPPTWWTVVVSRGRLSVESRYELRQHWLDFKDLAAGRDLPEGPLVGPVSEAFGMAIIAHIRKGGGDAHLVAYAPSDPKPLCHPPGRPWISSLIGQASRPGTALPSARPSLAPEPSAQS